ncbi:MAG: cytochrome b5-like heme/steroid binding domain-containing protein [Candidatus Kerfeldbacteria bacterium]
MKREYLYAAIIALAGIGLVIVLSMRYQSPSPITTTDVQKQNASTNGNQNVNVVVVNGNSNASTSNANVTVNTNTTNSTPITLTLAVIAQHDSASDCWLVISGQVYDVTSYLRAHPGGVSIVVPYCGTADATQAFRTKAGQGSHSSAAHADLIRYKLGPVNGTITVSNSDAVRKVNPSLLSSSGQDGEGEDDND